MKDFLEYLLRKSDNITTGKIYSDVLKKERQGGYLGKDSTSNSPYNRSY